MAHCFTVDDTGKTDPGIVLEEDEGVYYIPCGLPRDESVRLNERWCSDMLSGMLEVSTLLEAEVKRLETEEAPAAELEAAKARLRTARYVDPHIERADFDEGGMLTKKLHPKHRGDALVHLCISPGKDGELVWTASTYEEFVNDKGKVDRKYHSLKEAVGVSVLQDGDAKLVALKPHASIRFERTGDTDGGDVRVMLKWIPPRLHWRTLQAAPEQVRKAS